MVELTNCHDCGVEPGERHKDGCDTALCVSTGFQHLQCEGEIHVHNGREYGEHEGDCAPSIWRGIWPGVIECREFNLWSRHIPGEAPYWQNCSREDEGAMEDLNELHRLAAMGELTWSREGERWVKP